MDPINSGISNNLELLDSNKTTEIVSKKSYFDFLLIIFLSIFGIVAGAWGLFVFGVSYDKGFTFGTVFTIFLCGIIFVICLVSIVILLIGFLKNILEKRK